MPIARKEAFTRTHIVEGFERAGIYPLNPERFDFLTQWRQQQANGGTPLRTASSPIPDLPDDPSSPARKQRTNEVLADIKNVLDSPPATPTRCLDALSAGLSEIVQYRTRTALQGGRIRELQGTKDSRHKKKGDRRRVPVESLILDQAELDRLRLERDRRDAEHTRGRGRGRGRGDARGRGRVSTGRGCGPGRGRGRGGAQATRRHSSDESDSDIDMPTRTPSPTASPKGQKRRSSSPVYYTRSVKRSRHS